MLIHFFAFRKDCECWFPRIWTAQALCTSSFHLNLSQRVNIRVILWLSYGIVFTSYCVLFEWVYYVCVHSGIPARSHSVLLQYSVNGGIIWVLLHEFYFPSSTDTLLLHLPLPPSAQTNATRFRLWQPYNNGEKTSYLFINLHTIFLFTCNVP